MGQSHYFSLATHDTQRWVAPRCFDSRLLTLTDHDGPMLQTPAQAPATSQLPTRARPMCGHTTWREYHEQEEPVTGRPDGQHISDMLTLLPPADLPDATPATRLIYQFNMCTFQ